MNIKQKTLQILSKFNLKANKRFGQNFLVDDEILEGIVETANISSEDIVVEIGPGLGNLTEYLLKKSKKVIAFEIDKNMIEVLKYRFDTSKLDIVYNDILKVNIDDYIYATIAQMDNFKGKVKVVANLPYYITTPIIFDLFEKAKIISDITIMIQKEVAERIVASTGTKEYGVLSVMCNYYADCKVSLNVPPDSFIPAPNVYSSVINLSKRDKYKIKDIYSFSKLIKAAFSQRRKKMINSITSNKELNISKDRMLNIYKELNISENVRAEEISIEDFIKIYEKIDNN